jgi:hypothetical protein
MYKKLLLLLVLAISFSACKKNNNNNACGIQTCTASFAIINFAFTDANGEPTTIKDVSLINVRTGKAVPPTSYAGTADLVPGAIIVATDETKNSFSAEGDDVRITATSTATSQTKQVVVKVSGGCKCHVEKISGPETVKFD